MKKTKDEAAVANQEAPPAPELVLLNAIRQILTESQRPYPTIAACLGFVDSLIKQVIQKPAVEAIEQSKVAEIDRLRDKSNGEDSLNA